MGTVASFQETDIAPVSGLYPYLGASEIKVAVYQREGERMLYRALSPQASLDAQTTFEREKTLWAQFASWGLSDPVQEVQGGIVQPFTGEQLSQVAPFYLRKHCRTLFLGIARQFAEYEDRGWMIEYASLASFSVESFLGTGKVVLIDNSTAVKKGSVQAVLTSLAYCLLELSAQRDRVELPGELSCNAVEQYRSLLPPGIYNYLLKLVDGQSFSTVRDAYHVLQRVSWEPAGPEWKKFIPGYRVGLCSFALAAFLGGGILARVFRQPDQVTAGHSDVALKLDTTLLFRNRIFVERSCVGCDLSGWDFIDADLQGVNLSGANLTGARIIRSKVSGINLSEATLDSAKLEFLTLRNASLRGASLQGTNFYKVALVDADVSHVDFSVIDQWSQEKKPPEGEYSLIFKGVNLDYAILDNMTWRSGSKSLQEQYPTARNNDSFRYASMKGFTYKEGDLTDVDFTGANLTGANFQKTTFDGAVLDKVIARDVDFYRALLTDVMARDADFDRAHLDGAWVTASVFDGSTMRDASLRGMKGAQSMSLVNADMRGVDTFWTSFD